MGMKKRSTVRKRHVPARTKRPKKLHHRIISFFKGDGGIYVIFILATVMAAAFALSGGVIPTLSQNPTSADQVEIDEDSAKQSSESALQLVDIKIKPSPTPTPTLSPTTTPGATITPPVQACLNRTVITLMIDLSASMKQSGKAEALSGALGDFTDALFKTKPTTYVGGTGFGAGAAFSTDNTAGVKHIIGYTRNESLIRDRLVNDAVPGGEGGTYMRRGFDVALNRIKNYQSVHEQDNYRYVTVLFSDGVPEDGSWGDCYKISSDNVCWSRVQDPRGPTYSTSNATDLTAQLKSLNERVYTIGIYDSRTGARARSLTADLKTLLGTIASKNSSPYVQFIDLANNNPKNLTSLFTTIVNDVCK